jgi:hypothetical protein
VAEGGGKKGGKTSKLLFLTDFFILSFGQDLELVPSSNAAVEDLVEHGGREENVWEATEGREGETRVRRKR